MRSVTYSMGVSLDGYIAGQGKTYKKSVVEKRHRLCRASA
jgi:hypothetical protein